MGRINLLDKHVAELIAAGEVVERPASIVKELIENAVDAGAGAISVEIKGGGTRLIRVTDNGNGIEREDVPVAFLRHATSKVRVSEDLDAIMTMGFRGEALASIAAVSRVEILTRTQNEVAGTRFMIEGGEPHAPQDAGCPVGTTITVRDVFYNTPARMKFLKKDVSEGNSVTAVVEKCALANPGIAFKLIREGQMKLQTPGDGELLSAIRCVLGKDFSDHALKVDYQDGALSVKGFIGEPSIARGSRTMQNFFINNRFIRSKTCMAALEEAFRNTLMVGRFPSGVLNIEVPPQSVDVNVHPAKTEVRFSNEKSIFHLVYYGCKTALSAKRLAPEIKLENKPYNPFATQVAREIPEQQQISAVHIPHNSGYNNAAPQSVSQSDDTECADVIVKQPNLENGEVVFESTGFRNIYARKSIDIETDEDTTVRYGGSQAHPEKKSGQEGLLNENSGTLEALEKNVKLSSLTEEDSAQGMESKVALQIGEANDDIYQGARVVGEIFDTYVVLETSREMILIDKHAAHERILFNRLLRDGISQQRQLLLSPVRVRLSPEEYHAVLENQELLFKAGLTVDAFGDEDVVVREIAPVLDGCDIAAMVYEFAQRFLKYNMNPISEQLEDLFHSIACHSAIRAHDKSDILVLEQLVALLLEDKNTSHCPHGRPVAVRMTQYEIDKKFGRLG